MIMPTIPLVLALLILWLALSIRAVWSLTGMIPYESAHEMYVRQIEEWSREYDKTAVIIDCERLAEIYDDEFVEAMENR